MTFPELSHNSFPSEAIDQWDTYEESLDDPLDNPFDDPSQGQTQTNELKLCQLDDWDGGKRGILPLSAYCKGESEPCARKCNDNIRNV